MHDPNCLTMTHRYPFDYCPRPNQTIRLVNLRRKFEDHEHYELRIKIQKHSSIKHPCLIKIQKAFESQKKRYFDIMFEWVRHSFRSYARHLTYGELQEKKLALLSLCQQLIALGVHPAIAEDLIGFTQNNQIKLYVDIDFSPSIGPVEQLIRAKQIEISNIFRLYERASLFEIHHHSPRASMHDILGRQDISQTRLLYQHTTMLSPQSLQRSRNVYLENIPLARSKSPPAPACLYNSVQGFGYTIGDSKINEVAIEESYHHQMPAQTAQTKHIDIQVPPAQPYRIIVHPDIPSDKMRSSQDSKAMKPEKDATPPESLAKVGNKFVNACPGKGQVQRPIVQQKQEQKGHQMQVMRQPRTFQLGLGDRNYKSEQESISIVDTYNEELGEMRRMPKISNTEFRQTTNEPPSIVKIASPEKNKNRLSTGNPQRKHFKSERLPLNKLQEEQSLNSQEQVRIQEQIKKQQKAEYKVENSYYYREAFGFGFQRNDPLTREFISLLQDQPIIEQEPLQEPRQWGEERQAEQMEQREQPKSNLNDINEKVKEALRNSKRALQLFERFKSNCNF